MGLRGRLDSRLVRGDRPLHTRSGLTVTVPIRVKLRASRPQACRSLSARCLIKFAAGRELPGLAGHHARHGDLTHPGLAILMVATPTRGARGEEAHGVQIHSDRRTHSWAFQGGISRCGMTPRDRACRSLTRRRRYGGAKRNQCTMARPVVVFIARKARLRYHLAPFVSVQHRFCGCCVDALSQRRASCQIGRVIGACRH